jgi:hypothetical protein
VKTFLAVLMFLTASLAVGQQPRQATLAQQKMCADQAKKVFAAQDDYTEYTSHYEAKTNVCYLWEARMTYDKTTLFYNDTVIDAFEGRQYAGFTQLRVNGGKHEDPTQCWVNVNGQLTTCYDFAKFSELVEKYFGVAQ